MYEYQGKNVIIMLCSKCNINCKHCYIKYNGNFSPEELKKILMEGTAKAQTEAKKTMEKVKHAMKIDY